MRDAAKVIRAEGWWHHKVPVYLSVLYLLAVIRPESVLDRALPLNIALFLLATIGLAGLGHVWNDVFDHAVDDRAGKVNNWRSATRGMRASLSLSLLLLAVSPWLFLPRNPGNLGGLLAQSLLLAAYAAPPLRLKERLVGPIVDGLYAYTVPILITWFTFEPRSEPVARSLLVAFLLWGTVVGARSLLHHQIRDEANDRRSGVATAVVRMGRRRSLRIVMGVLLPLELLSFAVISARLSETVRGYLPLMILVICVRALQVERFWKPTRTEALEPDIALLDRILGDHLNYFYERWFPILMLAGLVLATPKGLFLLAAHLALFPTNALSRLVRSDARNLADGFLALGAGRRTAAPSEPRHGS